MQTTHKNLTFIQCTLSSFNKCTAPISHCLMTFCCHILLIVEVTINITLLIMFALSGVQTHPPLRRSLTSNMPLVLIKLQIRLFCGQTDRETDKWTDLEQPALIVLSNRDRNKPLPFANIFQWLFVAHGL